MRHHNLDASDKKILTMIAKDARTLLLEVARACNISGTAIHQRVQKLINLGAIKDLGFIFNLEKIGYETCAFIGLYLKDLSDFDRVADRSKKVSGVVEYHYPTGDYNLFIKLYVTNNHHLMSIIYDKLQLLRLSGSETMISLRTVIDRQLPATQMEIEERSEMVNEEANLKPQSYEKETTPNIAGGR